MEAKDYAIMATICRAPDGCDVSKLMNALSFTPTSKQWEWVRERIEKSRPSSKE